MVYRSKYLTVPVVASDIETLASLSGFDFCDWSRWRLFFTPNDFSDRCSEVKFVVFVLDNRNRLTVDFPRLSPKIDCF